jgi:hypothetical protein
VNGPDLGVGSVWRSELVKRACPKSRPLAAKYREVVLAQNGEPLCAQEFPASVLPASNESAIVLPTSILRPGLYHFQLDHATSEGQFLESADWLFRVVKEW